MASHEISRRVALGAAVIFAGCAGSSSAPVFDYATATGPFHYDVTRTSTTTVETPSGETGSDQALDAMLVVALGGPMEDGRQVTVTFSSLDMRVETMRRPDLRRGGVRRQTVHRGPARERDDDDHGRPRNRR